MYIHMLYSYTKYYTVIRGKIQREGNGIKKRERSKRVERKKEKRER